MELNGNIIEVLPLQSGESKNGAWKKQDFVIETEGSYPKKVCISMWGDKINENIIKVGTTITASIEVESREYNGRWYTDVKAWKLEGKATENANPEAPKAAPVEIPAAMEGEDDLPF